MQVMMTADELRAFIDAARAQAGAVLARLATVDYETLPPDLQREYERLRARRL